LSILGARKRNDVDVKVFFPSQAIGSVSDPAIVCNGTPFNSRTHSNERFLPRLFAARMGAWTEEMAMVLHAASKG
jgi:hypothetical protein